LKKFFLFLSLFGALLEASQIEWHKDYTSAHEASVQKEQILLVFVTTDDCKFCKKLKNETFLSPEIIERISQSYQSVEVNEQRDTYPKALGAKRFPTIYFLTPEEEIIDYTLGYYNVEDFGYILNAAEYRYKKMKPFYKE